MAIHPWLRSLSLLGVGSMLYCGVAWATIPWERLDQEAAKLEATGSIQPLRAFYQEKIKALADQVGPDDRENYLNLYFSLGRTYIESDDKQAELAVYEQALTYCRAHQMTQIVGVLQMAGDLYGELGQPDKKLAYWKESILEEEKILGPDHHMVANDQKRLAMLYKDANRLTEYEALLKKMADIRMTIEGPNRIAAFGPYYDLGTLYESQHRLPEALAAYQQAESILDWAQKTYPKDVRTSMLSEYPGKVQAALKRLQAAQPSTHPANPQTRSE
jgi:tetratricopeptide (TPR) repeat protein